MESLFRLDAYDPWARALAILIDSGMKGILLLSLAAAVVSLMRKSSAAARHLVWALSLCGLLLLPLLPIVVPKWQLPILPQMQSASVQQPISIQESPAIQTSGVPPSGDMSSGVPPLGGVQSHAPESSVPRTGSAPIPPAFWVLSIWLAVALITISPLIIGIFTLARMVNQCHPFTLPGRDLETLARSLGLRRTVRILQSGPDSMPMAAGLLRAAILLPASAADWDDDKRRSVLLHELAHVKRRDCLTHALARIAVSIHWFNPLAWFALRRMRIERERACDDMVLTAGERPSAYADHLLDIARTFRAGTLASTAAITMARQSQLEGRLLAVLDPTRSRRALKWRTCALGILVLIGLALPLGIIQLSARESAQSKHETAFSRGARATVLGIAEQGKAPNRPAWLADGTPLDFVPEGFQNGASVGTNKNEVARIFYLEITTPNRPTNIECRVDGHHGATATSCENGRIRIEMAAAVPARDKKTAVEIGVADGPWVKLIEGTPGNATSTSVNNMNLNVSVMFSDVLSDKGRPCVIVSHDVKDRDWRVVAFDDKGASHIAQNPESTGFAGMNQSKIVFPDLTSSSTIKRLELQAREYEWRKIEDVALRPDPRLAAGRLPRPTIQAHRFYPVGTGPVIMLSTATSENVVKLKDGRPLLFFKINGTEEPLTIGMSPFSAFGRMTHHLSIPGDVRDGKPLSPGHYKVSVVFRDFKVYPKDGGEPRTIDALETNVVEFDVVDKLPEWYITPVYNEGWDKLLRERTEYIFNDERCSYNSKYDPMLLGIKIKKSLPFALAFDVYAECEGNPERQLVGTLNTTGEIGVEANFAAKGLTWQNAPTKKWRLSFKPSAKVALRNPPIREYYGREVVGDWVSFTPSPGYKTQLGMGVAPQLRIVNSWPVGTKMPRVGWQPDGAPIKDEPTDRVFETYPLLGAANNDKTPNRTFVEVMIHHPLFDNHSKFDVILHDLDNNRIAAPITFGNDDPECHKRFPGWRDKLLSVDSNQLPAVGKVELRYTFGPWTGVCGDFTPFDGEKEISSDVTIQSIKPLGKDKTEVRYITTNRSLGETYQYSAAAVTSLEFARGGLVETRDQDMKSRGNGYLYTARLNVPFKEIKKLRIRCRPVQRFTFENVAFAPKKTEPKKAELTIQSVDTKPVDGATEYTWCINTTDKLQIMDRGLILNGDGTAGQNWGMGINRDGDQGPVELSLRARREGNELIITTMKRVGERKQGAGEHYTYEVNSTISASLKPRITIPDGATFECNWRKDPVQADARNYMALWEGRFVRDGKIIQTVVYAAAIARLSDNDIEKELDLHGREGKDFPLIRLSGSNQAASDALQFRWVAEDGDRDAEQLPFYDQKEQNRPRLWVSNEVLLGTNDVAAVAVQPSSAPQNPNGFSVSLQFTKEAAKKFEDLTSLGIGRQLAIVVDGKLLSAPIIHEPIKGGRVNIAGGFSMEEAQRIVLAIKSAMPARDTGRIGARCTVLTPTSQNPAVGYLKGLYETKLGWDCIKDGVYGFEAQNILVNIFYTLDDYNTEHPAAKDFFTEKVVSDPPSVGRKVVALQWECPVDMPLKERYQVAAVAFGVMVDVAESTSGLKRNGRPGLIVTLRARSDERSHAFAIYRVAGGLDALEAGKKQLAELKLEPAPVLTERDILSYEWDTQLIHFTPEAFACIPEQPAIKGDPFVIVAGGERICLGAFWPMLSSYRGIQGPTIWDRTLVSLERDGKMVPNTVHLRGGVIRYDERILTALVRAGKLAPKRKSSGGSGATS